MGWRKGACGLAVWGCLGLVGSWPGAAAAYQAPVVGDEGLEPGERRVEVGIGTLGVSGQYRLGWRRTGLTGVAGLQTEWVGGFTTVGAGGCYRLFGGYPLRLVLRGEAQLAFGPGNGPSFGGRLVPGIAAEVGREGRLTAAVGASLPLGLFVAPTVGVTQGLRLDGVVSRPFGDDWRAGLGIEVGVEAVRADDPLYAWSAGLSLGLARWL